MGKNISFFLFVFCVLVLFVVAVKERTLEIMPILLKNRTLEDYYTLQYSATKTMGNKGTDSKLIELKKTEFENYCLHMYNSRPL